MSMQRKLSRAYLTFFKYQAPLNRCLSQALYLVSFGACGVPEIPHRVAPSMVGPSFVVVFAVGNFVISTPSSTHTGYLVQQTVVAIFFCGIFYFSSWYVETADANGHAYLF